MRKHLIILVTLVIACSACKKHKEPLPAQPSTPVQQGPTDTDGNVYDTVVVGSQVWMAQNLRVRRYSNGDSIPYVSDAGILVEPGSNECCV